MAREQRRLWVYGRSVAIPEMNLEQPRRDMPPGAVRPYHAHRSTFLVLVLSGGYVETGEGGRHLLEEGDVVFHPAFHGHYNEIGRSGARVLNLELGLSYLGDGWVGSVPDPGRILALARNDPPSSIVEVFATVSRRVPLIRDWPDLLANAMIEDPAVNLGEWAAQAGLGRETISRGFRKAFGITPARYQANIRARRAWSEVLQTRSSLAEIALRHGFYDQAHMTRAICQLTACPPGRWRRLPAAGS